MELFRDMFEPFMVYWNTGNDQIITRFLWLAYKVPSPRDNSITFLCLSNAKHLLVLTWRISTFGNPELDSKHPLSLNCRSQGWSFNHIAHTQNATWQKPALHQQPDNKIAHTVLEIDTVLPQTELRINNVLNV